MMFSKPVIKLNAKVFSSTYGKTKEELLCDETVWGANMLTLEDDMLTVKTDAVRIIPARSEEFKGHTFFEGASIRKIGDTYYFIYSSELNHELCYATSKYPDKGFVYGGTIVSAGDIGFHGRKEKESLNTVGTTHGSIEKINGQWYVFYHRLTHASDYSRQGCAEKIYIENDGSIKQVEITSCGLNDGLLKCEGKYPAIIACNISNGKMPRISNRKSRKPIPAVTFENGERFVANIDNGTEVAYKYFDFQKSSGKIVLDVFSAANGTISIFTGAVKISEISISKFGRRQIESDFEIKTSKKNSLKFRFSGKGKLNLYSFEFKE